MRFLLPFCFAALFFMPISLKAQSLYSRLKCDDMEEVKGPVTRMQINVLPARMDHRRRQAFFEYDDRGRLREKELKGERWVFEYDEQDRVTESRRFFKGYLQEVRKHEYRDGRVKESVFSRDEKTLLRQVHLELDHSQRPVEMEVRFPGRDEKLVHTASFSSDKVQIATHSGDGYKKVETHNYSECIDGVLRQNHNVQGQLLREVVRTRTSSGVLYFEHIYKYDKVGNWIYRKTFRLKPNRRELLQEIEREITYGEI